MHSKSTDYGLLIIVLILVLFGAVMVYSASSMRAQLHYNDSLYFFERHLVKGLLGLVIMLIVMRIDYQNFKKISIPLLIISLLLLGYMALSNDIQKIRGVGRWIRIFGVSIQPSEIMKFALVFYMSDAIVRKQPKLSSFIDGYLPLISILIISVGLIALQPDLSTAALITMIIVALFFAGKIKISHLLGTFAACVPVGFILIFKSPHKYQANRITAFWNPDIDPLGIGYQVKQSLIGLGNGGILGVGLGESKQKLLFLPEPYKDFIFSIIGEELGFIGTSIIIILFSIILWRGLKIAAQAPDLYGTLLASGITLSLTISAFINMSVVCNLLPPTGFPLPFLSYGGNALLLSLASVGVLLNISSKGEPVKKETDKKVKDL